MEVKANFVAAIVLFLAAQTCIIAASLVMFAMVGEINRKLPAEQQVGYLGWHFFKYRKVFREYRRLYPGGRLSLYSHLLAFSGFTLLATFAVVLGFFR